MLPGVMDETHTTKPTYNHPPTDTAQVLAGRTKLFQCGLCQKKFAILSNFFHHYDEHKHDLYCPLDMHVCQSDDGMEFIGESSSNINTSMDHLFQDLQKALMISANDSEPQQSSCQFSSFSTKDTLDEITDDAEEEHEGIGEEDGLNNCNDQFVDFCKSDQVLSDTNTSIKTEVMKSSLGNYGRNELYQNLKGTPGVEDEKLSEVLDTFGMSNKNKNLNQELQSQYEKYDLGLKRRSSDDSEFVGLNDEEEVFNKQLSSNFDFSLSYSADNQNFSSLKNRIGNISIGNLVKKRSDTKHKLQVRDKSLEPFGPHSDHHNPCLSTNSKSTKDRLNYTLVPKDSPDNLTVLNEESRDTNSGTLHIANNPADTCSHDNLEFNPEMYCGIEVNKAVIKEKIKSKNKAEDLVRELLFKCGACKQEFPTICSLHSHMENSKDSQSYYFDNASKMCIPKNFNCCFTSKAELSFAITFYKRSQDYEVDVSDLKLSQKKDLEIVQEVKDDLENTSKMATRFGTRRVRVKQSEIHENKTDQSKNVKKDIGQRKGRAVFEDHKDKNENEKLPKLEAITRNNNLQNLKNKIKNLETVTKATKGRGRPPKAKIKAISVLEEFQTKRKRGRPNTVLLQDLPCAETIDQPVSLLDDGAEKLTLINQNIKREKDFCEIVTVKEENMESQLHKCKNSIEENASNSREIDLDCNGEDLTALADVSSVSLLTKKKKGRPRKPDHELKEPRRIRKKCTSFIKKTAAITTKLTKENRNERIPCNNCDKLLFRYCMKNHLRACTMDRPFSCDLCPAKFATKGSLVSHCKCVHLKENPYQCEFCGERFFVPSKLAKHKRNHTGERNFVCSICDKRFMHEEYLKKHEKLHTGIKDQICATCGRMFYTNWNLRQHELTHMAVGAFPCTLCQKSFTTKRGLKKHLETACTRVNISICATDMDDETECPGVNTSMCAADLHNNTTELLESTKTTAYGSKGSETTEFGMDRAETGHRSGSLKTTVYGSESVETTVYGSASAKNTTYVSESVEMTAYESESDKTMENRSKSAGATLYVTESAENSIFELEGDETTMDLSGCVD